VNHAASLSFFFPAYNEEDNVRPMVENALRILGPYAERLQVVIVDDGSRDGTADVGRRLAAENPSVTYVRHETNRGYGEAIRSGLNASTGELVFFSDGDRQFDLAEISRLWDRLEDADLVVGYRIKRADPPHRLVIAETYNRILRRLFGIRIRDVDCAFKLMRAEVAHTVQPTSGGAFFSAEFVLRANARGYRIVEVGVTHLPRTAGRSKGATPAVILRTFREMFALRRVLRKS
jgi:glycosyltransferase involved in cell wall biosynthesis